MPTSTLACEKPTNKYPNGRRGTFAGHRAHIRVKEKTCEECKQAYREYKRKNKERRVGHLLICEVPTPANPDGRTGTMEGYRAHRRARQTPCEACAEAHENYDEYHEADPFVLKVVDALPYEPKRNWRKDAACKGLSPSVFIQSVEEAENNLPINPLAKQTCSECAVQIDCAIENVNEEFGVWGGLSISARRRLVKHLKHVDSN